jgi:hypothetical protein
MPQPWNFFILTIAVLSIITYLTYSNPIQYLPYQWQQTLPMSNAGKNGSYEAPYSDAMNPKKILLKIVTKFSSTKATHSVSTR